MQYLNFIKKHQKTILTIALCLGCFTVMYKTGWAADDVDISTVTEPIDRIYTLIASIISGVGGIFLLMTIPGLASAFQAHDTAQQISGGLKAGGAILVAVAPWVVKYILG